MAIEGYADCARTHGECELKVRKNREEKATEAKEEGSREDYF